MPTRNAEEILERLLERGIITEEQVKEISGCTPEEVRCAEILHTIFCRNGHGAGGAGNECRFYHEGPEKLADLQEWVENARGLAEITGVEIGPLAKLTANVSSHFERRDWAERIIIRAISLVRTSYTLKDFLDGAASEGPHGTSLTGIQGPSETQPQSLEPLQGTESPLALERLMRESLDPFEQHPTTNDGSESH